jgi:uncharacterized protein (DUF433 family)
MEEPVTARRIVQDDATAWGEPRVARTGTPVWAVVGCFIGGDSMDEAASAYGLTWREMEECVRFQLMSQRQREKYLAGLHPFRRSDYAGDEPWAGDK